MRFHPVENNHAYRAIVDQVCDAILREDLHAGDRLPSERELAEQSGLSRSSVRQALEVLSAAGVVTVKPGGGGGAQITSDLVPSELIGRALETSQEELLQICEVRNLLEVNAAPLAVARASESQIAELEAIVDATETSVREDPDNKQRWLQLDIAFHHAVVRMTGNDYLVRTETSMLRRLLQVSDMAHMSEFASYGPGSMRLFLDALKRRDTLGAQMAIYEHVYPASRILVRYYATESTSSNRPAMNNGLGHPQG